MCGLFGLARPEEAASPRATSRALLMLGRLAEERGVDSAGLAYHPTRRPETLRPSTEQADAVLDGWRVLKRIGRFGELALRGTRPELDAARVVLGHTRHATQGAVDRLANSSPLATGTLLGTHNGDVTADRLRARYALPEPVGDTDSELLFAALAGAQGEAAILEVLSGLEGRVALAWVDRRDPGRLWLARGALSPLAVAVTTTGDLLWASNPGWIRRVATSCGLDLVAGSPALVPEGTLLGFDVGRQVRYAGSASFTPVPRVADLALGWAVWRGFGDADRAADQAGLRSVATVAGSGVAGSGVAALPAAA